MTDLEEIIKLDKIVFDDNNQEKNRGLAWDKPVPDR